MCLVFSVHSVAARNLTWTSSACSMGLPVRNVFWKPTRLNNLWSYRFLQEIKKKWWQRLLKTNITTNKYVIKSFDLNIFLPWCSNQHSSCTVPRLSFFFCSNPGRKHTFSATVNVLLYFWKTNRALKSCEEQRQEGWSKSLINKLQNHPQIFILSMEVTFSSAGTLYFR